MSKVIVYSTTACIWCTKVKDYLKSKKVEFEVKNVGTDTEAREEMINKSGQMGVPVTDIDGSIIVGFDKEAIDEALEL